MNPILRLSMRFAYSTYPLAVGGLLLLTLAGVLAQLGGSTAQVSTYVVIGLLAAGLGYYNARTGAEYRGKM